MKKFFIMLAMAGVSLSGMAQNETPELKYSVATNSFWSNWFVTAGFQYGSSYSAYEQEAGLELGGLFKETRRDLGVSLSLGKWFTPGMGLRTKGTVFFTGHDAAHVEAADGKIKILNIQEHALFNLHNLLCGYKENRVWNFIPYFGAGFMRNMSENVNSLGYSVGLLNTFRLTNRIGVELDLGYNVADYELFAKCPDYGANPARADRYFAAEVGLVFNLGKATWNKVPDVEAIKALHQSQIDALNAQIADSQAENDRLNNLIKNHKCPEVKESVPVIKSIAAPVSVFFNIGKSKVASRKDLQNVKELAEIAKNENAKIVVTGYADSKTGSAAFNQKLSEKRAETVANELVKMGVSRENIEVVAKGGVNDLTPVSYNRRATVAIK